MSELFSYLFEENAGTTVADEIGNGNTLTITPFTGDAWQAGGYGFNSTATTGSGIAKIADVTASGNVGPSLEGATKVAFIIKGDFEVGHAFGARIFSTGKDGGNGYLSIVMYNTNTIGIRWNDSEEVKFTNWVGGVTTIGFDIDVTAGAVLGNRIQAYLLGSLMNIDSGTISETTPLTGVNDSTVAMAFGNRRDLNRSAEMVVFAAKMWVGETLGSVLHAQYSSEWMADDSVDIGAPSGLPVITKVGADPATFVSGNAGSYIDTGFTALDDEDGDITNDIVITGLPTDFIGTHTVRANVADLDLNDATEVTRLVNVTVPTNYSFIALVTPDLLDDSKLLYGLTGDAAVTGDQLVTQNPSAQGLAFTQLADGGISWAIAPTVTQSINRYVIKSDGTVGTEAAFTYTVDGEVVAGGDILNTSMGVGSTRIGL